MSQSLIDLRSDTVTQPTAAMRHAMAEAVVGDDVYGEDPTVNELQERVAAILGKEAAVFLPSGSQSNLVALLSHCQRGDEYLAAADAHCYRYEGGGGAVLGGIQPQPVALDRRGLMDLESAESAIKPRDDDHFARTRLLCLENTHNGRVWPLEDLDRAAQLAARHGLAVHLDGARLFNAAAACGDTPARLARDADTVSVCLSKGLCAPAGSVLAGARETIAEARRWRKVVGGGMRQSGVLAAAGLVALDQQVDRLPEDHATARTLAAGLSVIVGLEVDLERLETNMIWLTFEARQELSLQQHLRKLGIVIEGSGRRLRLVTHQGIGPAEAEQVIAGFGSYYHADHQPTARPMTAADGR